MKKMERGAGSVKALFEPERQKFEFFY